MKGGLGWRVKETVDEREYESGREGERRGKREGGWRGGYNMPLSNLTSTGGHSTLRGEAHIFANASDLNEPFPNRPKYPARPITPLLPSIHSHTAPPQY
jgi:hypothetical protein